MISIQKLKEINKNNETIIVGTFSTLHLGHQLLINEGLKYENTTLMRINKGPRVLSNLDINHLVERFNWNINNIFDLDFSQIKDISAHEFINILKQNNIKNIICGNDFVFGKNRLGTIEMLKNNFNVTVLNLENIDGKKISTSTIISKLEQGQLNYFKKTHGYNYFVLSKVIHGDKIGRTIDFPTINLDIENKVLPKFGVYGANVIISNTNYSGATYIGRRPTLDKIETRFETNILDFDKQIYDEVVLVELITNIRFEKQFSNLDELKKQIRKDVSDVKLWRNNYRKS